MNERSHISRRIDNAEALTERLNSASADHLPPPLPSRWLTLIPFGVLLIVALAVTIGLLLVAGGQS